MEIVRSMTFFVHHRLTVICHSKPDKTLESLSKSITNPASYFSGKIDGNKFSILGRTGRMSLISPVVMKGTVAEHPDGSEVLISAWLHPLYFIALIVSWIYSCYNTHSVDLSWLVIMLVVCGLFYNWRLALAKRVLARIWAE